MGSVAKAVTKPIKKVVKGVGSVVKKVASGVKKVAGGIVKGIDKVTGGGFSKIMGKLGPIGTIGLGMLMPGIGSMLGGLWSSAAGAASAYTGLGSSFVNIVGQGMTWAAQAAGTVTGGITSKIKSGLEWIGGKVTTGAENLFRGVQEFAGVKDPSSIKDVGSWVVNKAKEMNPFSPKQPTGTLNTEGFMPDSGWSGLNDKQIAGQFGEAGGFTQTGSGTLNLSGINEIPQGAVVGKKAYATDVAAGILPNDVLNQGGIDVTPRGTPYDPNAQFRYDIEPGSVSGTYSSKLPTPAEIAARNKPSFLDAALKAGGSLLNTMASQPTQQMGMMPQPYFAGSADIGDNFGSNRFGVGGQGSSGGDFLSEQQRYQQQLLAQQLSQLG